MSDRSHTPRDVTPPEVTPPDATLPESCPLPARPDEAFDRFTRLVRGHLGVPVALVSLIWQQGQVFPGAAGLPEPWATQRSSPLSYSFCQHVVRSDEPLIVPDVRIDPLVLDNLSIPELGVVAYAGFPLHDADGVTVGSLCAIDMRVRQWTDEEMHFLHDLAAACSSELQLRAARERAVESQARAEAAAVAAEQAELQSRVLLALSESLNAAVTVDDVARTVSAVALQHLGARFSGVLLVDAATRRMRALRVEAFPRVARDRLDDFGLDENYPPAICARQMRPMFYENDEAYLLDHPTITTDASFDGSTKARALLPLTAGGGPVGVVILAWEYPRRMDDVTRAVMVSLAQYTAQAIQRAQLLAERRAVAETLQRAMLTELPNPDHLTLVARYKPAATAEAVGGDWYDALLLPDGVTALVIGDVVGHDIAAAATMGQMRNLLRAIAYDGLGTPASIIARLDDALRGLRMNAVATMMLARIHSPDGGLTHWLEWSTAGHPMPMLLLPDGTVRVLTAPPDLILGIAPEIERHDHRHEIPPGATLLLYTDGMIERRGRSLSEGVSELAAALAEARYLEPDELLDHVLRRIVEGRPHDDCAVLAVRFPTPDDLTRPPTT